MIQKKITLENVCTSFFSENESKGKISTLNHFMVENVPRRTIYDILKRIQQKCPHPLGQIFLSEIQSKICLLCPP